MKKRILSFIAAAMLLSLCSCSTVPAGTGDGTSQPLPTAAPTSGTAASPESTDKAAVTSALNTTDTMTEAPSETSVSETTQPPVTAPITTEPPKTEPATSEPPSPPKADESSGIVWTVSQAQLFPDTEMSEAAETLDADTAVLLLIHGQNICKIAALGGEYYVESALLTDRLPDSAAELMAKNGGVYYKGVKGLVAIDAGHQRKGMNGKEPLGPGSDTVKKMLSTGTHGVSTRIPEYVLNLDVALRLRNELISRGYGVVMIRESHDVTLSNVQRAKIANAYAADVFVRVHANGSTDRSVRGAYGICMTKNNSFNAALHSDSLRLSENVAEGLCEATGVTRKKTWQTDTMTGINWSEVPVTIIEMGYMSNPDEDRLMASDGFRDGAAAGIANGIDRYFAGQ